MKGYSKGKFRACLVALVCPWVFIVGYQSAEAQQIYLAQEAYAIFQQNCLNCHGEGSNEFCVYLHKMRYGFWLRRNF